MPSLDGFSVRHRTVRMFSLRGELDMATTPVFEEAISSAIAEGGTIVLDASDLTFLDSSGIRVAIDAAQRLRSGCVLLHGVHDSPARTLDLTQVDVLSRIHVIGCTRQPRGASQVA